MDMYVVTMKERWSMFNTCIKIIHGRKTKATLAQEVFRIVTDKSLLQNHLNDHNHGQNPSNRDKNDTIRN